MGGMNKRDRRDRRDRWGDGWGTTGEGETRKVGLDKWWTDRRDMRGHGQVDR